MCAELFNDKGAYEQLKTKNKIEFVSTSYIRGTTYNDSILIIDECQNLTFHELDSIITRVGHNCRIILREIITKVILNNKKIRKVLLNLLTLLNN